MSRGEFSEKTQSFQCLQEFYDFGVEQALASELYYGHGTDNAYDDIRWLLTASLALPFEEEGEAWTRPLLEMEKQTLRDALERRILENTPVPYIIHMSPFCGIPFYVDERVLIPRSPIAELIEVGFQPWVEPEQVQQVLDLCTGSGCIAMACAYAFPQAKVDATDLSDEALAVAQINRGRLELESQVQLIASDCWQNVPEKSYDIIVSNPPYVGDAEMDTLPQEYRHEPDMALRAPENGLAIVEQILAHAHRYLSDTGILVVEVGNSDEALQQAYPEVPFLWLEFARGGHGVFLLTAEQLQYYFGDREHER